MAGQRPVLGRLAGNTAQGLDAADPGERLSLFDAVAGVLAELGREVGEEKEASRVRNVHEPVQQGLFDPLRISPPTRLDEARKPGGFGICPGRERRDAGGNGWTGSIAIQSRGELLDRFDIDRIAGRSTRDNRHRDHEWRRTRRDAFGLVGWSRRANLCGE